VFIHTVFDLLAVVAAIGAFYFLPLPSSAPARPWRLHPAYLSFASLGMMAGAIAAGTANLFLSGYPEVGKSVLGGLAGAIFAVEMTKRRLGVTGSTGLRFAAPLAVGIVVGRLGCFFAGMEDRTYGSPTDLPWGRDFGDHIPRHPVQLYEAITMALFLIAFVVMLRRGYRVAASAGFYLFVGAYAGQRFLWEFMKPYGTVIGPFNLFHLICLGLLAYAWSFGRAELRHG